MIHHSLCDGLGMPVRGIEPDIAREVERAATPVAAESLLQCAFTEPGDGDQFRKSDAACEMRTDMRFGGMEISDARRLKALDEENRKLKKLLAEAMLDVATLREALGKTSDARRTENGRELGHRGEGLFAASRLRADRPGAEDVPLRLDPR